MSYLSRLPCRFGNKLWQKLGSNSVISSICRTKSGKVQDNPGFRSCPERVPALSGTHSGSIRAGRAISFHFCPGLLPDPAAAHSRNCHNLFRPVPGTSGGGFRNRGSLQSATFQKVPCFQPFTVRFPSYPGWNRHVADSVITRKCCSL